jgi:1,4-dihydroxy-2-naphthoate octaprenyltransferase
LTDLPISLKVVQHYTNLSILEKIAIWVRAIRAPFFTASVVPLLLGMAIAWYETKIFNTLLGILTLIAGIAIHTGTNLANDYFDQPTDNINKHFSPFNGGSRMIQNALLSPRQIMFAFVLSYFIGIFVAFLIIINTNGLLLLFFLFTAITLGFFYTAIPARLSYNGLGEIAVFVGFGPLGVISSYYIQVGHINSYIPVISSIPIAILIAMVLFLNEFQDYEADKKAGKRTLVVSIGKKLAIKVYISGIILTYITLTVAVTITLLPISLILPMLTLPLAIKAIKISKQNYEGIIKLQPANIATIFLHFSFGILMIIAFIFA